MPLPPPPHHRTQTCLHAGCRSSLKFLKPPVSLPPVSLPEQPPPPMPHNRSQTHQTGGTNQTARPHAVRQCKRVVQACSHPTSYEAQVLRIRSKAFQLNLCSSVPIAHCSGATHNAATLTGEPAAVTAVVHSGLSAPTSLPHNWQGATASTTSNHT
jgi:hypothetical protein